jgi:hypothetical protein
VRPAATSGNLSIFSSLVFDQEDRKHQAPWMTALFQVLAVLFDRDKSLVHNAGIVANT